MKKKELKRIAKEELRRKLETEEMLKKEKKEHEITKKEAESKRALLMDDIQLSKEMEESLKRQVKELEEELRSRVETKEMLEKEKEEHKITKKEAESSHARFTEGEQYNKYISKKNDELRESVKRQAKELEEIQGRYEALDLVESRSKELEKAKKEKKEAFTVFESFSKLYLEEVKRRVGMEEEPNEKDTSKKIISLLEDFLKCHPPPYFICPITQDVMQDPCVAADGFTYEAGAFKTMARWSYYVAIDEP